VRRIGTLLALAGAPLLVVSLFLDWYGYEGAEVTVFGSNRELAFTASGLSAWEVFELADIVLLLCALAGLTAVVAAHRVPPAMFIGAGVTALLIVAVSLVNTPPILQTSEDLDLSITREIGSWLALGGALAMLGGAALRRAP
jgi:hypothetical protein